MKRLPWVALLTLLAGAGLRLMALLSPWLGRLPACPLKAMTGLPCATCGLTRSMVALGGGRWSEAFHWHPVAVLGLAALPLIAIWDLVRAWKGEAYPSLPDSLLLRLTAGALLLGTWALQVARGI